MSVSMNHVISPQSKCWRGIISRLERHGSILYSLGKLYPRLLAYPKLEISHLKLADEVAIEF
jgi:hypothetical protein